MPIDYSKWDKLDVSSSDDDDDDDEENEDRYNASTQPRVTRLDSPSRVTFGGPGGGISATTTPEANLGTKTEQTEEESSSSTSTSTSTAVPTPPTPLTTTTTTPRRVDPAISAATTESPPPLASPLAPPSWTEHGGRLETAPLSAEAPDADEAPPSAPRCLYWAQDRYSVTLRIGLHRGVGGRDGGDVDEKVASVLVEGILPYRDRHCATSTTIKPRLVVVSRSGKVLLRGDLPHPVHLAEDDDGDDEKAGGVVGCFLDDWSVVTNGGDSKNGERFLVVTLYKAVPMEGLTLWWRRPLTEFPEADLAAIRGGGGGGSSSTSSTSSPTTATAVAASENSSGADFLGAWKEAHKLFRENKGKRKPMKIP